MKLLKYLNCIIIAIFFLSGCGTFQVLVDNPGETEPDMKTTISVLETQNAALITAGGAVPTLTSLSLQSTQEDVRLAILNSAQNWLSLWGEGIAYEYGPDGSASPPVSMRFQVWISQPEGRFRVLTGTAEGKVEHLRISDGSSIMSLNVQTGEMAGEPLPPAALQPFYPPQVQTDVIQTHPLDGMLGFGYSTLFFPTALAQRGGTYKLTGSENILGRETLVVEWSYDGEHTNDRFWVDMQTGLLLRIQNYGKGGGDKILSDVALTQLALNPLLRVEYFDQTLREAPVFIENIDTNLPLREQGTPVVQTTSEDEYGMLYFTIIDRQDGGMRLVRMPAGCLITGNTCPNLETIPGYPNYEYMVVPLVWSPDASLAAVPYPALNDSNKTVLYVFDPVSNTWASILNLQIISENISWSGDGKWIALRGQVDNRETAYVISPDGSQLVDLSSQVTSTAGEAYITLHGWLGSDVFFEVSSGGTWKSYLCSPDGKQIREFNPLGAGKNILSISHDRQQVAVLITDGQGNALAIMDFEGNVSNPLASFQQSGIYNATWARDDSRLAFAVGGENPGEGQIYVINRDGSNLRQVYMGDDVLNLAFSPDGAVLAVESGAGRRWIFTLNLENGQQHLLQAPGLSLANDWAGLSWQKK